MLLKTRNPLIRHGEKGGDQKLSVKVIEAPKAGGLQMTHVKIEMLKELKLLLLPLKSELCSSQAHIPFLPILGNYHNSEVSIFVDLS